MPGGERAARHARTGASGRQRRSAWCWARRRREARASESQKLLNWGWPAWDAVRLFDAGKPVGQRAGVEGHRPPKPSSAPPAASVVTRAQGRGRQAARRRSSAPTRWSRRSTKGQRVGTIKVGTAGGTPVASVPLVVLEPVPLAGIFGRAWDAHPALDQVSCSCRTRSPHHAQRVARHPCYLNGEYTRAARGQGLRAGPRLHLRRRRLRGGAGRTAQRLFRFDEHMARLERGLAKLRIANPLRPRAVARALPPAGRRR